jgi:sphingolipid 4-desaturase/C4-monooxygenase
MEPLTFTEVTHPEPHLERARYLFREHPAVRELCGHTPVTALFVLGVVAAQVGMAAALREAPWWLWVPLAWLLGAILCHGLWVLIHECTHNLVFARARDNALLQLFTNLPLVFPAAMAFRKYHLLHHSFQGDVTRDADLPSPLEARLVGRSTVRKALWLLFFWVFQALRVGRLSVRLVDGWYLANWAVQLVFIAGVLALLGPTALGYLLLSSIFAIGLHPVGARWIQEHYLVKPGQETYSYYGPFNWVAFNVGFHNEHHDAMRVSWLRLPKVRALAPELYRELYAHRSWTRLLLRFLFDRDLTLFSRVVRTPEQSSGPARAA